MGYQAIQIANIGIAFWLRQRKRVGRLKCLGLHALLYLMEELGSSPEWILDRLPSPKTVRRYVDRKMGRDEFFNILNRRRIRYVVLRWFEDLPDWPSNEDMDLLVHDDDLGKIDDLFVCYPRTIPCDIYSVTAISGWNNLPYYPPHIAELILRERVFWKELCYVPCREHHFLSLVYHVVFHKAEASGFPFAEDVGGVTAVSDHRYTETLSKLAHRLECPFRSSLQEMYILLRDRGWIPPIGTFRKLAERSEWLRSVLTEEVHETYNGELMLFTVREWAVQNGWMGFIMDWLRTKRDMLEVIRVKELDKREQQLASKRIRGGTWGQGPYPVSGGKPSVFVVVYDHNPTPVPEDKKESFPFIRNGHFFLKEEIRYEINRRLLRTKWVNCIHSSDDEIEAWEDLASISCPELIQEVREKVQKRRGVRVGERQ